LATVEVAVRSATVVDMTISSEVDPVTPVGAGS
jgi:hypothetical protein